MAKFETAEEFTGAAEGGYSNDSRDHGGETLFGISRKSNPNWTGWPIVDIYRNSGNFPKDAEQDKKLRESSREFYRAKYWNPLGLNNITGQDIAGAVYDFGVNAGIRRAGETLQRALNFLNRTGRLFPELLVDGEIGPQTQAAVNLLIKKGEERALLVTFSGLRVAYYVAISEGAGNEQDIFARSWVGRCDFSTEPGKV